MMTFPFTQSAHHDAKRSRSTAASSRSGEDETPSLQSLRVLIVEDDTDSRELLTTWLEDAGCAVHAVDCACEGYAAIESFAPQVMISDIGMPHEDGYSLMERVRARECREGAGRLPAIALTAFTSSRDLDRAEEVGFDAHMSKPVSISSLRRVLVSLARRSQKT